MHDGMSEIKTEGSRHQQTLCWDCANATGGCSWSNHWEHKPVDGWNAIKTKIKVHNPTQNEKISTSYIVIDCPEFLRDGEGNGLRRIRDKENQEREKQQIVIAYQCGVKTREIAQATGTSETYIYNVLKAAGIEIGKRKTGPKASPRWAEIAKREEQP